MVVEELILSLSYVGIFIVMAFTGLTGFLPGSKIPYILSGYFASVGQLNFAFIIITGALGHSLGNLGQYLLSVKYGNDVFKKLKLMPENEIRAFQKTFEKREYTWLFFGKIVDPTKLFISICAGIAKTPIKIFIPFILIGSIIWALMFTSLGYFFGRSFDDLKWFGALILIVGFTVIYIFMRQFRQVMDEEESVKKK